MKTLVSKSLIALFSLMLLNTCVLVAQDDEGDETPGNVILGKLVVQKDADGNVTSACVISEEFDDDLNAVTVPYQLVLDVKAKALCARFAGKEVSVSGHITEVQQGDAKKRMIKVDHFSGADAEEEDQDAQPAEGNKEQKNKNKDKDDGGEF